LIFDALGALRAFGLEGDIVGVVPMDFMSLGVVIEWVRATFGLLVKSATLARLLPNILRANFLKLLSDKLPLGSLSFIGSPSQYAYEFMPASPNGLNESGLLKRINLGL
jgi:hypothetical protein